MISRSPHHRMHLWPAPGVSPIDPLTHRPLPADGRAVRLDAYWRARLAEGSVVTAAPAAPTQPAPVAPTPAAPEET